MRGPESPGEIKKWPDRREHGLQSWTFISLLHLWVLQKGPWVQQVVPWDAPSHGPVWNSVKSWRCQCPAAPHVARHLWYQKKAKRGLCPCVSSTKESPGLRSRCFTSVAHEAEEKQVLLPGSRAAGATNVPGLYFGFQNLGCHMPFMLLQCYLKLGPCPNDMCYPAELS